MYIKYPTPSRCRAFLRAPLHNVSNQMQPTRINAEIYTRIQEEGVAVVTCDKLLREGCLAFIRSLKNLGW